MTTATDSRKISDFLLVVMIFFVALIILGSASGYMVHQIMGPYERDIHDLSVEVKDLRKALQAEKDSHQQQFVSVQNQIDTKLEAERNKADLKLAEYQSRDQQEHRWFRMGQKDYFDAWLMELSRLHSKVYNEPYIPPKPQPE